MARHLLARVFCLSLATPLLWACQGSGGGASAPVQLKTEDDKTLYALGLVVGRNLGNFNLTPGEIDIVKAGLSDQLSKKTPLVEVEVYGPKIQALAQARMGAAGAQGSPAGTPPPGGPPQPPNPQAAAQAAASAAEMKKKSADFEETAAKEPGAVKTSSGLIFKSLSPGKGASPKASDKVKVNYEGKLVDGTVFDSSYKRGQPIDFPLGSVIPCWTEGVQKMKVGEKAQLVCPSGIAYGDRGRPPVIPGGATLVFQVELLDIDAPGAPPTPPGGMKPPGHP
jgi:FKBP-type peptidyl-prolyl cis-trans isomerase FkpA